MKQHYFDKEITYDGTQLRSHWIYEQNGIVGNCIASFQGPCQVDLDHMVDLEDVRRKEPIYSLSMLHFIIECFDYDLPRMVLMQRLFLHTIYQHLVQHGHHTLKLDGDDLYDNDAKLSVSIATRSPVSGLIHTGLNILTDNTPVKTQGLKQLGIEASSFAQEIMQAFCAEQESMQYAACKVKGVQ